MSEVIKKGIVLRRSKPKSVLGNRVKQGLTAAAGAFALVALASYKGYANRSKEPDYDKLFKFSGVVGSVLGLFWSITPAARKDPEESVSSLKENIYPIVTAVAKRAADVGADEVSGKADDEDEEEGFRRSDSRKPSTSLTTAPSIRYSSASSLFSKSEATNRDRYGRGYKESMSFNDDDLTPSRYRV